MPLQSCTFHRLQALTVKGCRVCKCVLPQWLQPLQRAAAAPVQHQPVPNPNGRVEEKPLDHGLFLLRGAPRRADGAALPGASVLRLFAASAADIRLLCDARSARCLRVEFGNAGLLPPRFKGYPSNPQNLCSSCPERALDECSLPPYSLPGGELLFHLRRGGRRA